ncbi:MAG TPA: glutamine--fructose-6-phosphate transaminase (isomerizing) [Caulobacteraceae bacterium]|jgi:glucosamine--fructose-6-phosphate aminotransferase (isomerizing)
MCGIIGIVGQSPVAERLVDSLRRLEYRGYDSAGVASVVDGHIQRRRATGKLRNLEDTLRTEPLGGQVGIGHVRWATHGAPNDANAHPQVSGRVALVHNGIIENFAELKAELQAQGRTFESDTDTEVVAQMLDARLEAGEEPVAAFKAVLDRLKGAYALGVLVQGEDRLVMGARRGSPLVVGYGQGEMFLGSDALAVGPFTNRVAYLEEGDYVAITGQEARIFDASGEPADRPVRVVPASAALVEKGEYRHFMEKEIHEQPDSTQHTLSAYLDLINRRTSVPGNVDFAALQRIQIVACGTAYYGGLIGKYLFEKLAGLPVDVEVASEFRYRDPALSKGTLALAVSQSGETADTLAAFRWCKENGLSTAAIVNAPQSTMAREAEVLWPTYAGPEIGVASTKAFTAQVAVLSALAVHAAAHRGRLDGKEAELVGQLLEAPRLLSEALALSGEVREIAHDVARARDVLYLGRGAMYPMALEGALKLKEISYIHAEGYAAGELKHGPIALIEEGVPVIVIAPCDELFEKTVSSISEVMARGASVIMITDGEGASHAPKGARVIRAPATHPLTAPLVLAAPIQLLAYYAAVQKGADVDQPRNLAKSVTVE